MTRLTIRGYQNGKQVFEELFDADAVDLEAVGGQHALRLRDQPHMIEIEFMDEPDINKRFFRYGTDPQHMVAPVAFTVE